MLEKLAWECELASKLARSDPQAYRFAIFNAHASAWHLIEWVWEAAGPETRQKLGLTTLGGYRLRVTKQCPELLLCQQIANGGKHRRLTKTNDPAVRTGITYVLHWRSVSSAIPRYLGPGPVEHSVYDGERLRDALEVVGAALEFWKAELVLHGF